MKKAIIGAGGFAREVYWSLTLIERVTVKFFVDDFYYNEGDPLILPLSKFDPTEYEVIVAIGDPRTRFDIVQKLPKETKYFTHINSSVQILDPNVRIGEGSIICAGTIITTNVKLGKHTHLNLQTTIGHDCEIGNYFTTAPGAKVSGNCKIYIHSLVTIGSNAAVVKNIEESGTYIGVPVKKLN
jgi:UDP-3-O-[3-hydroxymyristoyl] glucosamine N-acyltransferase